MTFPDGTKREERKGRAETAITLDDIKSTPRYAYLVAAIAALGGVLFGYDIGVISGAENLLKRDFHLDATTEELAVAAVLIGSVIGGLVGGRLADRLSRRRSLLLMAAIYVVGAVTTAASPDLPLFVIFRVLTGIAVGASSMIVPMYIAELSPTKIRGGLVILQQLAISGGIFVSYLVDYLFASLHWGWRPMFGAALVPGVLLGCGMLMATHTPRWLAMRGYFDEARRVMGRVNPRDADTEMQQLRRSIEQTRGASHRELFAPGMRGALVAGVGLAILQQFVGPNTVLFYTPTIFQYAGFSSGSAGLLPTIYIGAALFVFVFPTIALVDVIGRKQLFYIGLGGMGGMLVLLGAAFHYGAVSWGVGVLVILLVYVACYSLSISPLFWLMSAEVFPNRLRGVGASYATVANWAANLFISVTFLTSVSTVGKDVTFWIYAFFAAVGVLFVWRRVPETRGRPLEHIGEYWTSGRRWPARSAGASAQGSS